MIRRLRLQFILLNMALATAILLAALTFVYLRTSGELERQSTAYLRQFAGRRLSLLDQFFDANAELLGEGYGTAEAPEGGETPYSTFALYVFEQSGTYQVEGLGETLSKEERERYCNDLIQQIYASGESEGVLREPSVRYLSLSAPYGRKLVVMDRAGETHAKRVLLLTLCAVGIGAFALLLPASWLSSRVLVRPVEQSTKRQQQLVSDLSHELKTPVAVIAASADVLRAHADEKVGEQEKWLGYITSETERMSSMISDMLQLARTAEAPPLSEQDVFDLSELAYETALPFESICFERGRTLEIDVQPDVFVQARVDALRQLLSTLLDNACKYADDGGTVWLSLSANADKVSLAVRNTGPVIPPESLPFLFDRFYRVDAARTRSVGGYGLGLAIAKKLVEENAGKIAVRSNETEGTVFTCTFRRAKKQEKASG